MDCIVLVLVVGRFSHWGGIRWFHTSIGERMELEVLARCSRVSGANRTVWSLS